MMSSRRSADSSFEPKPLAMGVNPETIFAHSSGSAPAAIAIIRITGDLAFQAGAAMAGSLPEPRQAALRTLRGTDGELLDEALLLCFVAPASSTGEDLVEFHCHGSRAVIARILAELGQMPGLREAFPGEFTRRAFENGKIDLTGAEGLADLLEAETEGQRRAALAVAGGALRRQAELWRERLMTLSARAEAAIDYDDEDSTQVDAEALAGEAGELRAELEEWLARPRADLLRNGLRVLVAGPPNAGKSSLFNALVEDDKAIVTAIAGTTRDVIEVPVAIGGISLIMVDTAGIRESDDPIESEGIARAIRQIEAADLLLWLGSPGEMPIHRKILLVHSKADLGQSSAEAAIRVSATTGEGVADLRERILVEAAGLLPAPNLIALNYRQATALGDAALALEDVRPSDLVLTAEALRAARAAMDRVTGRSGVEDLLDALFGRFCLGK